MNPARTANQIKPVQNLTERAKLGSTVNKGELMAQVQQIQERHEIIILSLIQVLLETIVYLKQTQIQDK